MVNEQPKNVPAEPEPVPEVSANCFLTIKLWFTMGFKVLIFMIALGSTPTSYTNSNGDFRLRALWPLPSIFRCPSSQHCQGCGCRWLQQSHALQRVCERHLQVSPTTWGKFLLTANFGLFHLSDVLSFCSCSGGIKRQTQLSKGLWGDG